jgi:hypothetical protein
MTAPATSGRRLGRLVEELAEHGLDLDGSAPWHDLAVRELDYALRPHVHERRVPTYGSLVEPTTPMDVWEGETLLNIDRRPLGPTPMADARAYADGIVSWLIRRVDGQDEWVVLDRPAGSERDVVVLAHALGAVAVQRHPSGVVRLAGDFGVYRWDGLDWHHEPPVGTWLDTVRACVAHGDRVVLQTLLEFAVHDLGARGIGAILVYGPDERLLERHEHRLAVPPPLRVTLPFDLAPLRHALTQVDGATFFDDEGVLRRIGVRLVPSAEAEGAVDALGGTRHTSGRRYSWDDRGAIVIVVSEDGPVSVLRGGRVLGESPHEPHEPHEPDEP